MPAQNEDKEVIQLAQIQFGAGNHLFDDVVLPRHLADVLVVFARTYPRRAIEVQEFMDLHRLAYTGPDQELSEILRRNAIRAASEREYTDEEVDDWSRDQKGVYSIPRRQRPGRSIWQRIIDMFR